MINIRIFKYSYNRACIGVSTTPPPPLQTSSHSFLTSPSLNLQNVHAPFFTQFPPQYWLFVTPLKIRQFFREPQKYSSFSSLTQFDLLKITKFLVKVSQFEFFVMTEKNIFIYRRSCHKQFQILVYLLRKKCIIPLKRSPPSFPPTPPLKIKVLSRPFPF